jgi:predicted transcriptional regulator
MGHVQYHLNYLENNGTIKSRHMKVYRVYYVTSVRGERDEYILATLRQSTPRDIVLFLIENPGASQGEIANHTGFSPPTINSHMSHLIRIGLVNSRKEGRFVKYYLIGDIKDITRFLKSYYPSLWDKLSSRLADLFLDISDGIMYQQSNEE